MAFFPLSGITGCISPSTATTTAYDIKYNNALIASYYKKDVFEGLTQYYIVVCVIGNHTQQFKFSSVSDRDAFYNTLP